MSRYQFTHEGERWWVGYDVEDATFFLDRDTDLDRDDYYPEQLPTFKRLVETAEVSIPRDILDKLRQQDPRDVTAAQASAISRMDQVSAALRASYPHAAIQGTTQPPQSGPQARRSGPYLPDRERGDGPGK